MPLHELACGITSALFVSPVMTVIDSAIIKSQIKKIDFKKALLDTTNDYAHKKIHFTRPFYLMFLVYSSTYSTANLVDFYCKKNKIDYKIPTLLATSAINISTIAYKDKEYSRLFNTQKMTFPKTCYGLFALRDMMTISSCFILKKDFTHILHNYMPINTADFIASLTLPVITQSISTPLHILAIDIYQRPGLHFNARIHHIKTMYTSVCIGRIIRVIPAFCIGGFLNDMLRNRF